MLELDGLYRTFGDVVALDGLTFTVPPGEVYGFLGPNGSGKTTTMRTILGISRAERGEVRWNGRPIGPEERLRFGYMPEERGLYPSMRVIDQLVYLGRLHRLSLDAAVAAARHWLAVLGLSDREADRIDALSLGNQQRVQLSAALIHDPDVLVLDEPFSGLDPLGIETMGDVLQKRASEGAVVLFSSHQLDLVEHLCESVAIVHRGRTVVTGRVEDLTESQRRLLVMVGDDRTGSWAANLPGVQVLDVDDGMVHAELGDGVDPQSVLDAARNAGRVLHFAFERRRLSEVFRQAVAS